MKLLLTSAGIKNKAIGDALVALLGKPVAESTALCIPTASYGHPGGGANALRMLTGTATTPLTGLGWKSLSLLELTALPSIKRDWWVPLVQEADALLVGGGDALYLAHWMRESGLADLLPTLDDTVYVGVSAGSMVLTPRIGKDFMVWDPISGDDRTLGLVGFSICPHVDHPDLPENSMAEAERWATTIPNPAYAIDDDTAIQVTGGTVELITEGHWKLLNGPV